jgi:hypothetical protein
MNCFMAASVGVGVGLGEPGCYLVVDIGGPFGFEVVHPHPDATGRQSLYDA